MPFFDFHVHPSLKAQFAAPANKPSPWDHIHLRFTNPDFILKVLKWQGVNEVVDSQANLSQLIEGGVNLVAIALHPPEAAMMNDNLIQKIAEGEHTRFIDNDKVDAIGTGNIYFNLLQEELDHLEQHLENQGKKLKFLRHIGEYNAADTQTVHAILTVEGPHAFLGDRKGKNFQQVMDEFWQNFRHFTEVRGVRIFAMNIAHLENNDFCNHAFGIQIFTEDPFYPKNTSLTNEGLQLLLQMKQKKILCDIKHTSLMARQQLYLLGWHGPSWPLVCTHAGLTGIHTQDRGRYFEFHRRRSDGSLRVKHYKPVGYLEGTSFNASSINLYDNDVVTIVNSGGMIGLSMDQRILGTPEDGMLSVDYLDEIIEEEFFSAGECEFFRDVNRNTVPVEAVLKSENIRPGDRQNSENYHARQFLNQVFHLFVIARRYGIPDATMAQRICIGSDFDGMINPVDCCMNVTELASFRDRLLEHFEFWEDEFEDHDETRFRVSDFISPEDLFENIFYRNGLSFLQQWYT